MKKVLTIAGSDCSGGAGIQADIKTITAHGEYALSVITALTAQNTTGVFGISECDPDFVRQQMDCVFTDIYPDSVKTGMVSSPQIISAISEKLTEYGMKNIVCDPVMVSTSGKKLISDDAYSALTGQLLPLARLITPNIPEAEVLSGMKICSLDDMKKAAEKIFSVMGSAVLVKGGHLVETANDLLFDGGNFFIFEGERVDNPNTHGTGCTLSSAIACGMANGLPLDECIRNAKAYITGALRSMLDLGKGSGPLDHMYRIHG